MPYLTPETLSDYAFVNLDTLKRPIKGVIMNCHGFTDESTFTSSPRFARDLGEQGVVYIFPYYSPWAWCSDSTLSYMEQVLDTVFSMLSLPDDTPFMISGGSMGGMTAMLYSVYGRRAVRAVACNCPVCNLEAVMASSPHVRRSVFAAYAGSGREMEEEILRHNPLRQVEHMPNVPYLIVSGTADVAVPDPKHADLMKREMARLGRDATFLSVEGMVHCDLLSHEEPYLAYLQFVLRHLGV